MLKPGSVAGGTGMYSGAGYMKPGMYDRDGSGSKDALFSTLP